MGAPFEFLLFFGRQLMSYLYMYDNFVCILIFLGFYASVSISFFATMPYHVFGSYASLFLAYQFFAANVSRLVLYQKNLSKSVLFGIKASQSQVRQKIWK